MCGECDVKRHMWNTYRILVESVKTGDDLRDLDRDEDDSEVKFIEMWCENVDYILLVERKMH
jgi:hypothetical protein